MHGTKSRINAVKKLFIWTNEGFVTVNAKSNRSYVKFQLANTVSNEDQEKKLLSRRHFLKFNKRRTDQKSPVAKWPVQAAASFVVEQDACVFAHLPSTVVAPLCKSTADPGLRRYRTDEFGQCREKPCCHSAHLQQMTPADQLGSQKKQPCRLLYKIILLQQSDCFA